MSLLSTVEGSVDVAFEVLKDFSLSCELVIRTEKAYDPIKDEETYVEVKYPFMAFELGTKETEQLNNQIEGVEFYLLAKFGSSVVPKVSDVVEIDSQVYEIKYIDKVKPGSTVILWTIGVAQ